MQPNGSYTFQSKGGTQSIEFTTTFASNGTVKIFLEDILLGMIPNKRILSIDDWTIKVTGIGDSKSIGIYSDNQFGTKIGDGTISRNGKSYYLNDINITGEIKDENQMLYFYCKKNKDVYTASMKVSDFIKAIPVEFSKQ